MQNVTCETSSLAHKYSKLEAVQLALRAFLQILPKGHIRVISDNNTVVGQSLINHQGGTHSKFLSMAVEAILIWCQEQNMFLSAKHLAGSKNFLADVLSRKYLVVQTEWTLDLSVLQWIWSIWGKPQVDLFATKYNVKLLFTSRQFRTNMHGQ